MYRKNRMRVCFVLLVTIFLTLSFGLHALQVEHAHFGHEHTHGAAVSVADLSALLHGADQKWFLILILLLVSSMAAAFVQRIRTVVHIHLPFFHELCTQQNAYVLDPIRWALRKGIVQNRLCE